MSKQTAMQQAIEACKELADKSNYARLCVDIMEHQLGVEKQQIVEAWKFGAKEASDYDHLIDGATDYFNQTYKQ